MKLLACHGAAPRAIVVLIGILAAESALAHDYWLAQEPWVLGVGDTCTVHLLVGDELEPELERPLQLEITTRYEWHNDEGTIDLREALPDSTLPVFLRRMRTNGTSLLVMDRGFVAVESTVKRFLQFLEHEERLDLASLYEDIAPDRPLRRRYARAIKALVQTGKTATGDVHSRSIGQSVEIRVLRNPHTLAHGTELPVLVQYEGVDVGNQLVKAFVEGIDGRVTTANARTDADGIARFVLDRSGMWVLRTTVLRRCRNCEDMDWDTYYATFSFVYR